MKNKQKNQASLFMILVLVCQLGYSQDYLITFSGSGQSNTVETVEVKNIAQQTTLTLNGMDTLLLTDVVGTGSLPSLNQGMSIYPNPANHASRLEFYNSRSGNTSIEIYDFSGRLLINKSFHLSVGSHAFTINGLKAGIYLVKVSSPEQTYSQRLVSASIQGLSPELHYEGITHSRQQAPGLKSISNIVAMQYNEGERLVFKAISGDYAHTKSLVPTENQNIDFEFMDCIDFDGNHYGVVTIGEQVWMAENLKYLPLVSEPDYGSDIVLYYYVYGYNGWDVSAAKTTANYQNYGVLYNWPASLNACPAGWHLPSDVEWTQLVDYVVDQGFPNDENNPNGTGNALKSCLQVNSPLGGNCLTIEHPRWNEDTLSIYIHYGFDEFGFSAFPGGVRQYTGTFSVLGLAGYWWTSSVSIYSNVWYRDISYIYGDVYRSDRTRCSGLSIRCIKDN